MNILLEIPSVLKFWQVEILIFVTHILLFFKFYSLIYLMSLQNIDFLLIILNSQFSLFEIDLESFEVCSIVKLRLIDILVVTEKFIYKLFILPFQFFYFFIGFFYVLS